MRVENFKFKFHSKLCFHSETFFFVLFVSKSAVFYLKFETALTWRSSHDGLYVYGFLYASVSNWQPIHVEPENSQLYERAAPYIRCRSRPSKRQPDSGLIRSYYRQLNQPSTNIDMIFETFSSSVDQKSQPLCTFVKECNYLNCSCGREWNEKRTLK